MTTQTPEAYQAELLEQIRHAIAHTGLAGRCRLCGDEAAQYSRFRYYEPIEDTTEWRVHHMCDRCGTGPEDTGSCSYCQSYGVVLELKPGLYHCPECFQRGLDSLANSGGAQW